MGGRISRSFDRLPGDVWSVLIIVALLVFFGPFLVRLWQMLLELHVVALGTVATMLLAIGFFIVGRIVDARERRLEALEDRGICSNCRYDCADIPGDRCPECGEQLVK